MSALLLEQDVYSQDIELMNAWKFAILSMFMFYSTNNITQITAKTANQLTIKTHIN